MFNFIARITDRYKAAIILSWFVLAAILTILAPSLSSVGVTDDSQFLPRDTESIQAQDLIKNRFAQEASSQPGSAMVVIHNPGGLKNADLTAATVLTDWLNSSGAPAVINTVYSPVNNAALSATLLSTDNTTLLISLGLKEASSSSPAREAVGLIREYARANYPDCRIYVTGGAGVSSDALTSIRQTIDKATLVTVILVVVLLLIIYRSPVAILVPLITIGVSYLIARSLAGFIAQSGMAVSTLVDAYLVVTLFGIGTDYCLFMVSRYKEELLHSERSQAASHTLQKIGPVIMASATTVIVALLCLVISRFGMNRNSGLMLAMGVAITLLAGLTLTPALIAAFGRRILWPARLQNGVNRRPGFWHGIGARIVRHPWFFILPIVVILAVPYLALNQIRFSASLIDQMPVEMDSVAGYQVWQKHFATGQLNPLEVLIESGSGSLVTPSGLAAIRSAAESMQKVAGVSGVTYYASPAGDLSASSAQIRLLARNLGPAALGQLSTLQTMENTLKSLAVRYPGVIQSSHFQGAIGALQQISGAMSGASSASAAQLAAAMSGLSALLNGLAEHLDGLAAEFQLQTDSAFSGWLKAMYFSTDGTITRLNVATRADPYSEEAIALVSPLRQNVADSLSASGLPAARHYVGGTAADQADILQINDEDFLRVLGLAVIGILLVTGILLRSLVAPLYMIITVLFNFAGTLGISAWLFFDVFHHSAMIYMLPIFVFVILVAVGADYNIFLVTRIREESQQQPLKEAIVTAVSNTGGVITSCGIILAGTFATLTTASLQMVFQVGAAIAIGVLIDTFLVRALLIPSIASLLGRWNWWPARLK